MNIKTLLENKLMKSIKESSKEEIYIALLNIVKEMAEDKVSETGKKKIYYILKYL